MQREGGEIEEESRKHSKTTQRSKETRKMNEVGDTEEMIFVFDNNNKMLLVIDALQKIRRAGF
eukprot:gnl/Chilomastix_caulleri/2803.p1 GENE.gnl/Chilomastix_caulleri/2803~~gnl/Chilomastix_caulleri/2803.p1  ORF type:complete len:63 (+),score=20.44 gnl/Chilomastix_caulleri/2803:52-240(+)